jgi:glycosyltransferase involved in cell wall biosynthesis
MAADLAISAAAGQVAVESRTSSPVRVLHVISSLEYGGAERQVVHLANAMSFEGFDVSICSLSGLVPLARGLRKPECLHVVEKRWKYDVTAVWRVAELMRRLRVDVAHAWLFDAEMVTRLAARLAGVPVVVASERNSDYRFPRMHYLGLRLTRSWFDVLVANSHAGGRFNTRMLGIPEDRIRVIHNGVDAERFRPGEREGVRNEMGVRDGEPVIGMVASFKRQKNHAAFFRMARGVLARFPRAWFWCVGEALRDNQQGAEDYHRQMRELVAALDVETRVRFLGSRPDMPPVYSAMDVCVLTSRREGTPNVLLEAMACGVPVVATDVADNAYLVQDGRTGYVVPLDDDAAAIDRVSGLIADPERRAEMGRRARSWVVEEFSIPALARKTARVYRECLDRKGRWPGR